MVGWPVYNVLLRVGSCVCPNQSAIEYLGEQRAFAVINATVSEILLFLEGTPGEKALRTKGNQRERAFPVSVLRPRPPRSSHTQPPTLPRLWRHEYADPFSHSNPGVLSQLWKRASFEPKPLIMYSHCDQLTGECVRWGFFSYQVFCVNH